MIHPIPPSVLDAIVRAALAEDLGLPGWQGADLSAICSVNQFAGRGDATTLAIFPPENRARATIVTREPATVAGIELARRAFEVLDSTATFPAAEPRPPVTRARSAPLPGNGDRVKAGDVVFMVEASARALLSGERVALNFLQRLCGIATVTRAFVDACAAAPGARAPKLLHTRKTTPLLRELERHAVSAGGGSLHRFGLFDEVLIKENHFALSTALANLDIAGTVRRVRDFVGPCFVVGAEARSFDEAASAIEAGATYVLMDNYTPDTLARDVNRLRAWMQTAGRSVPIEASGGIRLDNVAAFATSGVDRISVGALTHSARSVDLALDVEPIQ